MIDLIQHAQHFFSEHVALSAIVHGIGGFGIAVLLQEYIQGDSFVPPLFGWLSVGIGLATLVYAMMSY